MTIGASSFTPLIDNFTSSLAALIPVALSLAAVFCGVRVIPVIIRHFLHS